MEKLLELGCLQQVYRHLKRALGEPEAGEDYWRMTNGIMQNFNKRDPQQKLEEFLVEVNDPEEGESEDDWAISREIGKTIYQVLDQHRKFNVTASVGHHAKVQAEKMKEREEEELRKQKAADREGRLNAKKSTSAGAGTIALKSGAIRLTPEDRYSMMLLAQQEGGAVNLAAQYSVAMDFDDRDEGIELREAEPEFLRGQIDRMPINYRLHATNNASGGGGGHISAFGQEIRRIQNQLDSDELDTRTDMEKVAAKQDDVHRMRKAAFTKQQGINGKTADEVNQGAKPTPLSMELGETPQEAGGLGIRSAKDLALNRGGKIPPWMKPSPGGGVSFGPQSNMSLQEVRQSLPIYRQKQEIIDHVMANRVTVLVGEPGSGKTTQLTQYMVEAGLHKKGLIGCTQPRRVAATSVAERVAEEFGCTLGEEVGFSVRFNDKTSSLTIIRYMTDGMLLREALLDETFSRYSIIILDEAHERGVNTDVLFGLMKTAMRLREDLRLIVTSATLDIGKFCKFFGTLEPLRVKGTTFPVQTHHDDLCDDYIDTSISVVMDIHLTKGPGDVLVFLTGEAEIENAAARLHAWTVELGEDIPELMICPIYSALANEVQSKVFEPTPRGKRKVVLATNIAETSITIPDLYYVVDPGFCKIKKYNPQTGVEQLKVHPISQQQAIQRKGRAGRTGEGMCYRLYSEAHFGQLRQATEPEIQRCNLANIVLTLKAVGISDILKFEFMDPPSKNTLVSAQEKLYYLGALDNLGNLTPFGRRMSSLPVEPTLGRTLLTARDMGCLPSVLIAVSMMMAPHIFQRPKDKQEEADRKHATFSHSEGDQLTLVSVYNAWVSVGKESEEWARANYVNYRGLREAREAKAQLEKLLKNTGTGDVGAKATLEVAGGNVNDDEQHTINVRKALCAGYFFQAAERMNDGKYLTLSDRREVSIHPSSSVYHVRPKFVVYHELIMTTREYMRDVMAISSSWLVEVAPTYYGRPSAGKLTRKQAAERIEPKLQYHEKGNEWRISKLRVHRR